MDPPWVRPGANWTTGLAIGRASRTYDMHQALTILRLIMLGLRGMFVLTKVRA